MAPQGGFRRDEPPRSGSGVGASSAARSCALASVCLVAGFDPIQGSRQAPLGSSNKSLTGGEWLCQNSCSLARTGQTTPGPLLGCGAAGSAPLPVLRSSPAAQLGSGWGGQGSPQQRPLWGTGMPKGWGTAKGAPAAGLPPPHELNMLGR